MARESITGMNSKLTHMKDSLYFFIEKNRSQFDDKTPSEKLWKKINSRLPSDSQRVWDSIVIWRAAAIFLLAVSIALLFTISKTKSFGDQSHVKLDFAEMEKYYTQQIFEKKELINQYQDDAKFIEDQETQNLRKLEASYQELKNEMNTKPTAHVKNAITLNLLVCIDLLNQQISRIDKARQAKEDI